MLYVETRDPTEKDERKRANEKIVLHCAQHTLRFYLQGFQLACIYEIFEPGHIQNLHI